MDVQRLSDWLLTEYKSRNHRGALLVATVRDHVRKMRHLESCGLDWDRFARSPRHAHEEAMPILAAKARNPKRGYGVRDYQKVLNRVVAYLAATHPRQAWREAAWALAPEPKGGGPMQDESEVRALDAYDGGRTQLERSRHRCIIYLDRLTRFRRGELASLTMPDFRPDFRPEYGAVLLRHPEKWGHARAIPMPKAAWRHDSPLQEYLAVRHADRQNPQAFWVRRDGMRHRAMTASDLGVDLNAISIHVGFRVSCNRLRKYEYTSMKRNKTDPWVMLYLHGGSNFRVLERYLGPISPDEAHAELAARLPGWE